MTTDREASWVFYSEVLGWEMTDSGPDMGHYGMAAVGGRMVAGIGTPPDPDQAPPPAWMTYLATDDLDKTCEAITANGGQIALPRWRSAGPGGWPWPPTRPAPTSASGRRSTSPARSE